MRAVVQFLVALCCVVAGAAAARAEKRVALIVGNSSYAHIAGLPNVPNDAQVIGALFKAANFDAIDVLINLDVGQLRRALKMFAAKAADADVAVLYYAGHGIEVGQTNYLIPVDARLATDFDVEDETVPLDRVLQAMEPAKRLRLVLLDACRENPFLKSMKRTAATRSVGRGLGRLEPASANTLIAFATKPNAVAADGKGPNSPFTTALVKHLLTPGLDLRIALGKVRDEVMVSTGGRQEPYVTSSLGGEVVAIVPGAPGAWQLTIVPPANEAAEAWATVKDSTSIAQLEVIAERYKETVYADLAQARIADLKKQKLALAVPPASKPAPPSVAPGPVPAPRPEPPAGLSAYVPLTAAKERVLKPKDGFKECGDCPEMVVVPAGRFTMGSPPSEWMLGRFVSEGPQHGVTIARPLAFGKFEVTFAEWDACVTTGGCQHQPSDEGWGRGKRPVMNVSWNDVTNEFIPWLSRKTGKSYRLPSEAEWEYAARAGTTTPFAFGNTIGESQARYNAGRTVEVGSFRPNAFGLHDMHGNVWEWVQDIWNESYNEVPSDGTAWLVGDPIRRVLRGGSWEMSSSFLRSAHRFWNTAGFRYNRHGFRVVRTIEK